MRHYDDPDRAGLARQLKSLCQARQIPLIIAGDARLALNINADGLHLPEGILAGEKGTWRLWRRSGMLLSIAAHSPEALTRAAKAHADFALLSPVFPSKSHPENTGIGVPRFAAWAARAKLPVFALGGVNKHNMGRILTAGAAGWAAIDGLSP
jgi:thiamine-phosphate pyrophosphorylase